MSNDKFTFEISLSVLDHLGRNLYRSFATVIGEAISNAWDADAREVYIYIDRDNDALVVKDTGDGMTSSDFQEKFLKIGYSKRGDGSVASTNGRPFIGRKGIGKLALLSCADRVSVISKVQGGEYVGGTIDNSGLDDAITEDLTPQQYSLDEWDVDIFETYISDHDHGTIIYFENIRDGIKNTLDFLKKITALYFRFSLLDENFNIYINDEKITLDNLEELANKTEFLWIINNLEDPYISEKLNKLKESGNDVSMSDGIQGFVASVEKPSQLKITTTDERASVDLFVNGRLRERDILKHVPTARIAENYFYGQIHFNELDDDEDRFTSSREGVVADDKKFEEFLAELKTTVLQIVSAWDKLRVKHRKDGDPESERIPPKRRKSLELYNVVSDEYEVPEESENRDKVSDWIGGLSDDAAFNFESYAECFISENLIRKYIHEKNLPSSPEADAEIEKWKRSEVTQKEAANININIRRNDDDLSYLDMTYLVVRADAPGTQNSLRQDSKEYRPIRNAVAHTSLLTDEAKRKMTAVYDNIKARIKNLLSE